MQANIVQRDREKRADWIVPLLTLPNISNIMQAMVRRAQRDKYHIEYYNTYVKLCCSRVFLLTRIVCSQHTVKQHTFDAQSYSHTVILNRFGSKFRADMNHTQMNSFLILMNLTWTTKKNHSKILDNLCFHIYWREVPYFDPHLGRIDKPTPASSTVSNNLFREKK